jgi:hypothetical protein
MADT